MKWVLIVLIELAVLWYIVVPYPPRSSTTSTDTHTDHQQPPCRSMVEILAHWQEHCGADGQFNPNESSVTQPPERTIAEWERFYNESLERYRKENQ